MRREGGEKTWEYCVGKGGNMRMLLLFTEVSRNPARRVRNCCGNFQKGRLGRGRGFGKWVVVSADLRSSCCSRLRKSAELTAAVMGLDFETK